MFKYEFDNWDRWRVYNQANSYSDSEKLLNTAKGNFGELVFYRWCRAHIPFDRWRWYNRYSFNRGLEEYSPHDFEIDGKTVDVKTRTDLGDFGSSIASGISSDICVMVWLRHKGDSSFGEAAENYEEAIGHVKNGITAVETDDGQNGMSVAQLVVRATDNMEDLSDNKAILIGYSPTNDWKNSDFEETSLGDPNLKDRIEYVNLEHLSSLIDSESDIDDIYHEYSFGDGVKCEEYDKYHEVYELPSPANRYDIEKDGTTVADEYDCDPKEPYIGVIPRDVGPRGRYAVPPAIGSDTIKVEPLHKFHTEE